MNCPPASSSASPKPPFARIGRFQILRELGSGTVGTVYLAHDPVIDRSVAIKTFSQNLSPFEKKQREQQFINEARVAGRLSHPNIVTIFDASNEGGMSYIAMEYLHGRELSKLLREGKRFDPDETAAIVAKIADALDYAHKRDVVHRDIKPANIFIADSNQPKIVDFGIARAPNRISDNDDEPYTLYHSNLLGTPNYMSPEQAMGLPADSRSDIYSLGAMMYEMLTVCKPFKGRDTMQLLQTIAHKTPVAPNSIDASIPSALSDIVMKAMSKRPEKRYQHAGEMVHDIRHYLAKQKRSLQRLKKEHTGAEKQLPVTHSPPSPSVPRRRPLLWIGGAASLIAVAVLGFNLLS